MSNPNLDPVSVSVLLATALVGERYAAIAGPYTVILFAWFGGVLMGLYRREPSSRGKLALFVVITFVLTFGLTVPAADLIARYAPAGMTALLFPVAFLIPAVGEDWIPLVRWAVRLWKRRKEQQ
jgi:hypothetical protein